MGSMKQPKNCQPNFRRRQKLLLKRVLDLNLTVFQLTRLDNYPKYII